MGAPERTLVTGCRTGAGGVSLARRNAPSANVPTPVTSAGRRPPLRDPCPRYLPCGYSRRPRRNIPLPRMRHTRILNQSRPARRLNLAHRHLDLNHRRRFALLTTRRRRPSLTRATLRAHAFCPRVGHPPHVIPAPQARVQRSPVRPMPHAPHHAMRKARVPDRRHRNVPQRHHQIVIRRLPRHGPQRPVIRPPRIRPQPRVIQELKPPPRHIRIAPRRRVVPNLKQRGLKPNVVIHARRRRVRQPHIEPRNHAIHRNRRDQRDQSQATPTNGQWQSHRASLAGKAMKKVRRCAMDPQRLRNRLPKAEFVLTPASLARADPRSPPAPSAASPPAHQASGYTASHRSGSSCSPFPP